MAKSQYKTKHTVLYHLFMTEPHAAQSVCQIVNSGDCKEPGLDSNECLVTAADEKGKNQITFTGEELDDLALRWLKLRARAR